MLRYPDTSFLFEGTLGKQSPSPGSLCKTDLDSDYIGAPIIGDSCYDQVHPRSSSADEVIQENSAGEKSTTQSQSPKFFTREGWDRSLGCSINLNRTNQARTLLGRYEQFSCQPAEVVLWHQPQLETSPNFQFIGCCTKSSDTWCSVDITEDQPA